MRIFLSLFRNRLRIILPVFNNITKIEISKINRPKINKTKPKINKTTTKILINTSS